MTEDKKEYMKRYYQDHKEHIQKIHRKYSQNLRKKVFEKLGNKCVKCGFSDIRALQIDHVHGNGVKELRKLNGDSPKFYNKVLANTSGNYQILCANCNWIKKSEKGENVK